MFTPRDSDSQNTHHPDSANEALRIIGSMIETLTWGLGPRRYHEGVRLELRDKLFQLCQRFGIKTRLAWTVGGHTWGSIRPKLLRHAASLVADIAGRQYIALDSATEELLREMCELLDLEVIEETSAQRAQRVLGEARRLRRELRDKSGPLEPEDEMKKARAAGVVASWRKLANDIDWDAFEAAAIGAIKNNTTGPGATVEEMKKARAAEVRRVHNIAIDPNRFSEEVHEAIANLRMYPHMYADPNTPPGPEDTDTPPEPEDETTDTPPHLRPITIEAGEMAVFVAGLGVLQTQTGTVTLDKPRKCFSFRMGACSGTPGTKVPEDMASEAPRIGIAFENDDAIVGMINDLIGLLRKPL